jgi:hypothetical protein
LDVTIQSPPYSRRAYRKEVEWISGSYSRYPDHTLVCPGFQ